MVVRVNPSRTAPATSSSIPYKYGLGQDPAVCPISIGGQVLLAWVVLVASVAQVLMAMAMAMLALPLAGT